MNVFMEYPIVVKMTHFVFARLCWDVQMN